MKGRTISFQGRSTRRVPLFNSGLTKECTNWPWPWLPQKLEPSRERFLADGRRCGCTYTLWCGDGCQEEVLSGHKVPVLNYGREGFSRAKLQRLTRIAVAGFQPGWEMLRSRKNYRELCLPCPKYSQQYTTILPLFVYVYTCSNVCVHTHADICACMCAHSCRWQNLISGISFNLSSLYFLRQRLFLVLKIADLAGYHTPRTLPLLTSRCLVYRHIL